MNLDHPLDFKYHLSLNKHLKNPI